MAVLALQDILSGIQSAVASAQTEVESQHVRNLSKYFEKDGTPIYVDVRLPDLINGDQKNTTLYKIPLLALVPITAIKIKELSVDLQVRLSGIGDGAPTDEPAAADLMTDNTAAQKATQQKRPPKAQLAADLHPGIFAKRGSMARMTLTFESGEPAEGFLKLNDLLLKLF